MFALAFLKPVFGFLKPFLPYILAALALVVAVWYIDKQGYKRAKQEAEFQNAVTAIIIAKNMRKLEDALSANMTDLDKGLSDKINSIELLNKTVIQPTIVKELANDPRYLNPDAGISISLLDALNSARTASACTARPNGGVECSLPAVGPDSRSDDSGIGER